MFRLIVPVIICMGGPLNAQPKLGCTSGDPDQSCQQVLACIGTEGRWFNGEIRGAGPVNEVVEVLDHGAECAGQRTQFNKPFAGSIRLDCKDAGSFTVDYDMPLLGDNRDYGCGRTEMDDGQPVQIWVGDDLITTLRRESGGIVSLLPCAGGAIRLD